MRIVWNPPDSPVIESQGEPAHGSVGMGFVDLHADVDVSQSLLALVEDFPIGERFSMAFDGLVPYVQCIQ